MKLREIVSAHDPDKAQAGTSAAQIADCIDSVPRPNDSFETADVDARIVGDPARCLGARLEVVQSTMLLQRISRRDQPPDPVEPQAFHRKQADGAMRGMGRIERAAEQPDARAIAMNGNDV